MIKNCLHLLLFLFCSFFTFGQKGFLSSKNMLDISVHGNMPLLSGSFGDIYYKRKGDKMIEGKDYINYGISLSYNRILTKRFSLGIILATKDYLISTPSFYTVRYDVDKNYNYIDTFGLKYEALKFRNYNIGPQFEFSTKQGILGMGFSYDIALGLNVTSVINGKYYYSIYNDYNAEQTETSNLDSEIDYFDNDFDWKPMFGLFLQTGFKFRVPIHNHFSFFTGLRYMGTFMIKGEQQPSQRMELIDNEDYYYKVSRKNLFSISFNLGFTCHF